MGHGEPALVAFGPDFRGRLFHEAERRVAATADIDAVVAGGAALVHEHLQPGLGHGVQCLRVAAQVAIERRVRGGQGRLEDRNGLLRVGKGDRLCLTGKRLAELLLVARDFRELLGNVRRGRGHLDRIDHRAAGLRLEVLGAAVPELGRVEDCIQHRRRIAAAALPVMTDRSLLAVDASHAEVVAGITTDRVTRRESRIEEQLRAQLHLGRRGRIPGQGWRCSGNGLEQRPRGCHQWVGGQRRAGGCDGCKGGK